MTDVKICGIRRPEDITYVNKYRPDYVGFIFADSPRRVAPEQAEKLIVGLKTGIKSVGVFVNEKIQDIVSIVRKCNLDVAQIHGDEPPDFIVELKKEFEYLNIVREKKKIEIWKAIRIKDQCSIFSMSHYDVDAFVLDTYNEGSYGGVGRIFDWNLAKEAKKYGRIILAGGLNLDNVRNAVTTVVPYGVDVSSGVEINGLKDQVKIGEFIRLVRE
jgi:phosphoribosylanthranilate isomerase